MDIKASYKWLKEYCKTDKSAVEFARELSLKSMSVEGMTDLREFYAKMVIGVVGELKAHPDADKLRIAVTNIGEREVEIVCGGTNLAEGMRVLVAMPGAKVRWHGEGDLIEMKVSKIRGIESFGMICAPVEIGFEKVACGDSEIWDLGTLTQAAAGTSFVDALDIDDIIFDIEVTTNRPDVMGMIGLAREGAAAVEADLVFDEPELPKAGTGKDLNVTVEDAELCPRYMAVVIDGVKVGPSPTWMQTRLLLAGQKPINNIVDVTNYVRLELAQPLHTFDYSKVKGAQINVRTAKEGEKMLALDDEEYILSEGQLVIADEDSVIAIAGVMGGKATGTMESTTTVVLEAAAFEEVQVRKTSRALNLRSDSQQIFEKGLSTKSPEYALARAVELVQELAGGEVVSSVIDVKKSEYQPLVFPMKTAAVRKLIGLDITDEDILDFLQRLGFHVAQDGDAYQVTVPFWRDHDIESGIDFTEEVARMYGYHNMPAVLPDQAPPNYTDDQDIVWERWLKRQLAQRGYTEFYGLSFASEELLEKYDLDASRVVKILNPLSTDATLMRPSLVPGVLRDIAANQSHSSQGRAFELQRVYVKREGDLPDERTHLLMAEYGDDVEVEFSRLKGVLFAIAEQVGWKVELSRLESDPRWHRTRSAEVRINGAVRGVLGQVGADYEKAFGLRSEAVLLELDLEDLILDMQLHRRYEAIPEFQEVVRDVSIEVDVMVEFESLRTAVFAADALIREVRLLDVYRGEGIAVERKSSTLSLTLRSDEKTLASEEIDAVMAKVDDVLAKEFDAHERG
jgi:phenylalanyl-tRNA synthetase beta chain